MYLIVSPEEQAGNQPQLLQLSDGRGYQVVETYDGNGPAWKSGHRRDPAGLVADLRNFKVDIHRARQQRLGRGVSSPLFLFWVVT